MKLIDADDFIKKFSYAEANTEEENTMCATVRRMVKEQPTAFDVEKVLEKLEEEREQSYEDFESYAEEHGVDNDYEDWFFLGLVRAIEIVKRGGRNEEYE